MNYPTCKIPLLISDREGIEIDYCSQCRGVWLDRGELDKIIERSTAMEEKWHRRNGDDDEDRFESGRNNYKKRRTSILGELFDIG